MPLSQSVLDSFQVLPKYMHKVSYALTASDRARNPSGGGFSLLEHACHLRDYEKEGVLARIHRILHEHHPFLAEFEGEKLAVERHYKSQDFDAAMNDFDRSRRESLSLLATLSDDQLDRTTRFGQAGTMTLRQLVGMIVEHDQTHCQEIDQLLVEIRPKGKVSA